jgi:hypothetical protein
MSTAQPYSLLIVEPNEKLTHPYNLIPSTYHITRVSTIAEGLDFVAHTLPTVIMVSGSFAAKDNVKLLEKTAEASHSHLPRLVFVVDLANPLSTIPGTTWGETTELLSSRSSAASVKASLMQD